MCKPVKKSSWNSKLQLRVLRALLITLTEKPHEKFGILNLKLINSIHSNGISKKKVSLHLPRTLLPALGQNPWTFYIFQVTFEACFLSFASQIYTFFGEEKLEKSEISFLYLRKKNKTENPPSRKKNYRSISTFMWQKKSCSRKLGNDAKNLQLGEIFCPKLFQFKKSRENGGKCCKDSAEYARICWINFQSYNYWLIVATLENDFIFYFVTHYKNYKTQHIDTFKLNYKRKPPSTVLIHWYLLWLPRWLIASHVYISFTINCLWYFPNFFQPFFVP